MKITKDNDFQDDFANLHPKYNIQSVTIYETEKRFISSPTSRGSCVSESISNFTSGDAKVRAPLSIRLCLIICSVVKFTSVVKFIIVLTLLKLKECQKKG